MGRRKYWPIYEAAEKHGLKIMSHAFGSYGNPITGAGWPSFYLEDHVGPAQAACSASAWWVHRCSIPCARNASATGLSFGFCFDR